MLYYEQHPLRFVAYSDISDQHPEFIAQTKLDTYGRNIVILKIDDQYFACIA